MTDEVTLNQQRAGEIVALRWMRERVPVYLCADVSARVDYWEIEGKDCTITVERRQPYCDRGNYIAKLHPTGKLALEIDFPDGWPRYYFDPLCAMKEIDAWLVKRGQRP